MTRINAQSKPLTTKNNLIMDYYTYNPISSSIIDRYDTQEAALLAIKDSTILVVHVYKNGMYVKTIK